MPKKLIFLLFILFFLLLTFSFKVLAADSIISNTVITKVGNPVGSPPLTTAFYCQHDPSWSNMCYLGAAGCVPSSFAIIFTSFGDIMTPPEVDRIFRENGWRGCDKEGSLTGLVLESNWLHNVVGGSGYEVANSLAYYSYINATRAKEFLDAGYLILASSENFPCISGNICEHAFVIVGADPATDVITVSDPNNCTNTGVEVESRRYYRTSSFSLKYAFPLKKK